MSKTDNTTEQLPSTTTRASHHHTGNEDVWLRLTAFLSLKSPNTKTTYLGILNEWCQFLKVVMGSAAAAQKIVGCSDLHAIAYRKWLEERPGEAPRMRRKKSLSKEIEVVSYQQKKKEGLESTQSNATIAKKFAALRRMYRVLLASKLTNINPFDSDLVPPPPKDSGKKRPTEMIDFSLVKKILSLPNTENAKGLRDKAVLAALFGGGLRRSEITSLRIGDVRKSTSGTVYLYLRSTKARKDAEQPLPGWAAQTVVELAQLRRSEGFEDADYLFVSFTGKGGTTVTNRPISSSGIYFLFKDYCTQAGASQFATPHSARATAITKLLDSGIPHRKVQEFSRHASIQMVEVYDKRRFSVDENPAKELNFESIETIKEKSQLKK